MIMGPHHAIGVTESLASRDDLTQDRETHLPVVVILVHGFVSVTSRRDMIQGPCVCSAQRSHHIASIVPCQKYAPLLDLTPFFAHQLLSR
jgi:hypothetical protein